MSARGILGAINTAKYEVVPIGITKDGQWIAAGDPLRALSAGIKAETFPAALLAEPTQRGLIRLEEHAAGAGIQAVHAATHLDVVFPILHGPYGEDGTVQGLLELAGIAYVGAGVTASAAGMDKAIFKDIMIAHGIPVVSGLVFRRKEWERSPQRVIDRIEAEIGYGCFVKPANLGSSVGISKVHSRQELPGALDNATRYDRKIVVETAIDAREIEVSVLGNDQPLASVPGEIVPCNEFYDYSAKYIDGDSDLLIPAPISEEMAAMVRQIAIEAYMAIDCAGLARVDFLLDRNTEEVYLNELNTLPGFTPISMYPKLWEASGVSYPDLIDQLIQLALERHADKSRSVTTYQAAEQG
jgi:D-alanine-D-alanine ligase